MKKTRVGLVFGGRSVEHSVSIISARAVLDHLDPEKYEVVPIGVTPEGRWLTSGDARALLDGGVDTGEGRHVALPGDPSIGALVPMKEGPQRITLDIVFPLIHGTGGEDGTLQGLLELADLPYVGSGVMASSVGMDKILMKSVFRAAGLDSARFVWATRRRILEVKSDLEEEIISSLGLPCFTKPANGGSSVGVSKVRDRSELGPALTTASVYDRRVLIEEAIEGQEVECAILGNDEPQASIVGEIVPCHEFYDYSAKYIDDRSELIVPARITEAQAATVRAMAIEAFKAVDAAGLARVDFLVRRSDGKVLINEINTIPGFTPISMYPRLWAASGIDFGALVDRLIELGFERHEETMRIRKDYSPERELPGAQ